MPRQRSAKSEAKERLKLARESIRDAERAMDSEDWDSAEQLLLQGSADVMAAREALVDGGVIADLW